MQRVVARVEGAAEGADPIQQVHEPFGARSAVVLDCDHQAVALSADTDLERFRSPARGIA